jgi:lipopolysaccharide transport system ATP-binding protein
VASLLEVGTGFHPELTGRENIFLNGAILGMRHAEIKRRFDEIVAFSEVENFLDTPVKRFSSGMYVRLAFAVAAHLHTEILIVDEVLAVGDAEFQRKCLGKMSEVAKGGRTVLLVSHQMNSIERLCQRVVWIERGRVAGEFDDARQGILTYLQNQGQYQGSCLWQGDGEEFDNEFFRPTLLTIASEAPDALPGEPFSNEYPLLLTVAGELKAVSRSLNIGVGIYSEDGLPLFWSFMRDASEADWPDVRPGLVKLCIRIPARWLNEGTYGLELLAGLHYQRWLLPPRGKVPSIQFHILGGLSDSALWDRKRPGLLAPVLRWELAGGPR